MSYSEDAITAHFRQLTSQSGRDSVSARLPGSTVGGELVK